MFNMESMLENLLNSLISPEAKAGMLERFSDGIKKIERVDAGVASVIADIKSINSHLFAIRAHIGMPVEATGNINHEPASPVLDHHEEN